jgi:hypothetical protein
MPASDRQTVRATLGRKQMGSKPMDRGSTEAHRGGWQAPTSLSLALGLWPVGLVGMFALFFGDATDRAHDPRDAVAPYFFAAILLCAAFALGLGAAARKRRLWMSVAAAMFALPWLVLSGWVLVAIARR